MDVLVVIVGIVCSMILVGIGIIVGGMLSINQYFKAASRTLDSFNDLMGPIGKYYSRIVENEFNDLK